MLGVSDERERAPMQERFTEGILRVVFAAFTICYVGVLQCDTLALTQHVLSSGHTHYSRPIGTAVITLVAVALQIITSRITRLPSRAAALTFIPSALLLATLTDLVPEFTSAKAIIYILLLLAAIAVYAIYPFATRRISQRTRRGGSFLSDFIPAAATLSLVMIAVGLAGRSPQAEHFCLKAQRYLNEGNYDAALRVGSRSLLTDSRLTMMRAYALSRRGELCEKLFEYPIPAGMTTLLPPLSDSTRMIFAPVQIYRWLGAMPVEGSGAEQYLEVISTQPEAVKQRPQVAYYRLATLLLTRRLDDFAATVKSFKADSASAPLHMQKHLREALVLYQHLRTHPVVTISDAPTEANYRDFMALAHSHPGKGGSAADASAVRTQYGDTYWWYYYYDLPQSKH